MRNFESEMTHITSLQDVYAFYDVNAISLLRDFELHGPWHCYLRTNVEENERIAAEIELRIAFITIHGKAFFDIAHAPGRTPEEVILYPDGEKVALEASDYILRRACQTKSPLLRARYHHLLWTGPKGVRRQERATAAIDAYLHAIQEILQIHEREPHKELPYVIMRLLETLLALIAETKYRVEDAIVLSRQLIFETMWDFSFKNAMIGQVVEHKILFTKTTFGDILDLYDQELAKAAAPVKYHFAMYYLPIAVKAVQKLGRDVKPWYNKIGTAILTFAKEGDTKADWVKLRILMQALEAFTKAANKEAIAEVEVLYAATQPTATLNTVTFELGPRENAFANLLRKDAENRADRLLTLPSEDLYRFLTTYLVVPSKEDMERRQPREQNDLSQLVSLVHLDNRKNILSAVNYEDTELYRTYSAHVNFSLLPFLVWLFKEGTRLGKIDYLSMIKYLNEHTWLGAVRIKTDLGGLRKTVTWLPLIQPALIEFFLQLEASQASKLYTPSYILCIDSLATKFEGLLRDFCERAAVPTSELKTKGMQTKFINAILEHQLIREHFSEDDLLLFYYVLTDKGQDIRNNVAHTFYEPANYTFEKMALLIFALFRIGQYEAE